MFYGIGDSAHLRKFFFKIVYIHRNQNPLLVWEKLGSYMQKVDGSNVPELLAPAPPQF